MASVGLAFWKRALEGAPALTEAPTDRQRPAIVAPEHYALVKQHFPPRLLISIVQDGSEGNINSFFASLLQACTFPLPR